jgi:hypothetical protein
MTAGALPPNLPLAIGELALNIPDRQLFSSAGGSPLPMIGVRVWAATAAYAVGDMVANAGVLYTCKTAHGPQAFTASNWSLIGGSGSFLPITGGTLTGNLTVQGFVTATGAITSNASLNVESPNGTAALIHMGQSGVSSWDIVSPAGSGHLYFNNLAPGGGTRLMLVDNGAVGIGTTGPSAALHIKSTAELLRLESTAAVGGNYLTFQSPSGRKGYIGYGAGSTDAFIINNEKNSEFAFLNNGAERLRINPNGYIGIANQAPGYDLDIGSSTKGTATTTRIQSSGANGVGTAIIGARAGNTTWFLGDAAAAVGGAADGNDTVLFAGSAGAMRLYTSNAERMRIDAAGNVGIGRTPAQTLDVQSAGSGIIRVRGSATNGAAFYVTQGGAESALMALGDAAAISGGPANTTSMIFSTFPLSTVVNGAERMRIDAGGNIGVGMVPPFYGADVRSVALGGPGINQAVYDLNINGNRTGLLTAVASRVILAAIGNSFLDFQTNGVDRLSINGAGVVTYGGIEVGYRDIPIIVAPAYERGKATAIGANFTIPAVALRGAVHVIVNDATTPMTLIQGGANLVLTGTNLTGNRTLAGKGIATLFYRTETEAWVSGPGVS